MGPVAEAGGLFVVDGGAASRIGKPVNDPPARFLGPPRAWFAPRAPIAARRACARPSRRSPESGPEPSGWARPRPPRPRGEPGTVCLGASPIPHMPHRRKSARPLLASSGSSPPSGCPAASRVTAPSCPRRRWPHGFSGVAGLPFPASARRPPGAAFLSS
ncbi:MAG: hypothetical protein MZV64_34340 [Ignavibacteriales bacterium]|nr:hypothetical protein [Ignavibacteriales bacterium]